MPKLRASKTCREVKPAASACGGQGPAPQLARFCGGSPGRWPAGQAVPRRGPAFRNSSNPFCRRRMLPRTGAPSAGRPLGGRKRPGGWKICKLLPEPGIQRSRQGPDQPRPSVISRAMWFIGPCPWPMDKLCEACKTCVRYAFAILTASGTGEPLESSAAMAEANVQPVP